MKRILIYTILTIFSVGCLQETDQKPMGVVDGTPIAFYAQKDVQTRTNVVQDDRSVKISWAESDSIGFWSSVNGQLNDRNIAYCVDGIDEARCILRAADPNRMVYWSRGAVQDIYAYSPYSPSIAKGADMTCIPVSLPAEQVQSGADSPAHIGKYGFMYAQPCHITPETDMSEGVSLVFKQLFAIMNIRLKLTPDCALDEIPVIRMKLESATSALTYDKATVNMTTEDGIPVVTPESSSNNIVLKFAENIILNKENYVSFYMMVAPGIHSAGDLNLEVIARDNSVYSVDIAAGVNIEPNMVYVRDFDLSMDSFVPADPYQIEIPSLNCKVGEDFVVNMSGSASAIDFWSGEYKHDYAYSDKERKEKAKLMMNFKMLLQNGEFRTPVTLKYSKDYDGTLTEEAINEATWTDVSDQFSWSTVLYGMDTDENGDKIAFANTVEPHDSGIVDISDWLEDGESCYVAFFYETGPKRTFFYLYDNVISSQYSTDAEPVTIYQQSGKILKTSGEFSIIQPIDENTLNPSLVYGESMSTAIDINDGLAMYNYTKTLGAYQYIIRLGAKNGFTDRPAEDPRKRSYLVLPKLDCPKIINLGYDTPVVVKNPEDETPETWKYKFDEPGEYNIVFVVTTESLSGIEQKTYEYKVTVS